MSETDTIVMKVVILGNPAVGKSSILNKFITGQTPTSSTNTIGAKLMGKTLAIGDKQVKLNIWDTAGQERYESFSKLYCRDASAAIFTYDVTDSASVKGMRHWYDLSCDSLPTNTLIFVVGNKYDLINEDYDFEAEVLEFADRLNAEHFRVSAVSGFGVDELFFRLAEKYVGIVKATRRKSIVLDRDKVPKNIVKKRRFC
jgi:small GTP-binding protein